ncbi:MAG: Ada metal-binding domain-containing protein [Anaerolineae bacterium]
MRTTGIFCRPSCRARKPYPQNVEFFATAQEALAAGYRPCKRCRPTEVIGALPDWAGELLRRGRKRPIAAAEGRGFAGAWS